VAREKVSFLSAHPPTVRELTPGQKKARTVAKLDKAAAFTRHMMQSVGAPGLGVVHATQGGRKKQMLWHAEWPVR